MLKKQGNKISAFLFLYVLFFLIIPEPAAATELVPEPAEKPPLLIQYFLNGVVCNIIKTTDASVFIIKAVFPYEIDLKNLIAEFETREDTLVFVNDVKQISGITANDFSVPVTYRLIQNDNNIQEYGVRIVFKPEFVMSIGANIYPSHNASYEMVNIGYEGDFFIGGKFNTFFIGLEIMNSYFVFNGQSDGENIFGYWNSLRGALVNRLLLSKQWGLKWGLGGSWLNSEFEFKKITRYTRNNPGFYLGFDVSFSPYKYISLDFLNQFNLFMDTEDGNPFASSENFYPYYKGGLNISFLNFIKPLRFNFGISGIYYYYKKDDINTTMKMLVVNAGFHFDLQFPSLLKPPIKNTQKNDTQKNAGSGIDSFRIAKQNDVIEFPQISFKDDSDVLTEESLVIISKIADVLTGKESMEILLTIYIKQIKDPVILVPGAIIKLKVIKQSLVDLGIKENRIHIPLEVSMLDNTHPEKSDLIKIVIVKPAGK